MGIEADDERIESTYRHGYSRVKTAADDKSKEKSAAFAEGTTGSTTDSLDELGDLMGGDWEPVTAPALAPVRALAAQSENYEEFTDGLAGLIKNMEIDGLAEALAKGQFAARIAGEAGIPISKED